MKSCHSFFDLLLHNFTSCPIFFLCRHNPIVEKTTQVAIGSILLVQLPDNQGQATEDYEIGWHLRGDRWGKGYATEAAKEILNYGFQSLQLPIIYAVVNPDNLASVRVTQRLGMIPMGLTQKYYGVELALFGLENEKCDHPS